MARRKSRPRRGRWWNASQGKRGPENRRAAHAPRKLAGLETLEERRVLTAEISLVADLAPGDFSSYWSEQITPAGDAVYFTAHTQAFGRELWRTDGTEEGTRLVADIAPDWRDSNVEIAGVLGSRVFFTAHDGESRQLWTTAEGETTATRLTSFDVVAQGQYSPERTNSYVQTDNFGGFAVTDDAVFFTYTTESDGGQTLWRTDGSVGGTAQVADPLSPVPIGGLGSFNPHGLLTGSGEYAYFTVVNTVYRSDGTAGGTIPIAYFAPFGGSASVSNPTPLGENGLAFTVAQSGETQLWATTDGSLESAELLAVVESGTSTSNHAASMGAHGDEVVLVSAGGTWRSDGTPAGTARIGPAPGNLGFPGGLTYKEIDGVLYVQGFHDNKWRLWEHTPSGGEVFVEVEHPGGPGHEFFLAPFQAGGVIYLVSQTPDSAGEIWSTSTSIADAVKYARVASSAFDIRFSGVAVAGNRLYYREWVYGFDSGLGYTDDDGLGARVASPDLRHGYPYSLPRGFVDYQGKVYFLAGAFSDLYSYDPATPGAVPELVSSLNTFTPNADETVFVAGDRLFIHNNSGGVWISDGTAGGTQKIELPFVDQLLSVNGQAVAVESFGNALHTIDSAGVTDLHIVSGAFGRVVDIASLHNPLSGTDTLYAVFSGSEGYRLSTVSLLGGGNVSYFPTSQKGNAFIQPRLPALFDGGGFYVYYDGNRASLGRAGLNTQPAAFGGVFAGYTDLRELTPAGDLLYFVAENDARGDELWALLSDGTTTELLLDGISDPRDLTVIQGRLYFTADDGVHGRELWTSDGTAAGTRLVADVRPGEEGSRPHLISQAKDRVVFAANDGASGIELWITDGDAAGTRLLADLNPGPPGSSPDTIHWSGDALLFSAYNPTAGVELHRYELVDPPDLVAESIVVSTDGGPAVLGETLRVEWTVANRGGRPTEQVVETQVWLSRDATLDESDWRVEGAAFSTALPLDPGGEASFDETFTTPLDHALPPGDYYVLVAVDAEDAVFEDNSENNIGASGVIELTAPPLPDLVFSNILAPPNTLSGEAYTATAMLTNQGDSPSGAFLVSGWITEPGSDSPLFVEGRSVSSFGLGPQELPPGESAQVELTFDLPVYFEGDFEIFFTADIAGAVFESFGGEENNTRREPIAVTQRPLPDLIITGIGTPPSAESDGPVTITWDVTNDGQADATAFADRVVIETLDGSVVVAEKTTDFSGVIGPGETVTQSATLELPLFLSGEYRVRIDTDWLDHEPETQGAELNNRAEATLSIVQKPLPDLLPVGIDVAESSLSGELVTVSWTVQNAGNAAALGGFDQRVLLAPIGGGDPIAVAEVAFVGDLADGAEATLSAELLLPTVLTGTFFAQVEVDTGAVIDELPELESNNVAIGGGTLSVTQRPLPDLAVEVVETPGSAVSGEEVEVRWTIENLGDQDFNGLMFDHVFLSPTGELDGTELPLRVFSFFGTIPAGESVSRVQRIPLPHDLEGDQRVVVRTNAQRTFPELGDDSNNTAVSETPIDVRRADLANLTVTEVLAPATAFSGQSLTVEWEVYNSGTGGTGTTGWFDRVLLSTDTIADDGDVLLGAPSNAAALLTNDGYRNTLTAMLPERIEGIYYVLVETNPNGSVEELGQTDDNLGATAPIQVSLTPPPDLVVESVSAPATAFSGQETTVSWHVANRGTGDLQAGSWIDAVWLSTDEVFDEGDTLFATSSSGGPLGQGESYTATATGTLPIGEAGEFYFFVEADWQDSVFEGLVEGSNVSADSDSTNVILTPPPDLEVESFTAPIEAVAGASIDLDFMVTNFGATATPNSSWTDRIYLSGDDELDPQDDTLLFARRHFGALEPGESYSVSSSAVVPLDLEGEYWVYLVVDDGDAVFEIDNDNNRWLLGERLEVRAEWPDLQPTELTAPATAAAGESFLVSWEVTNTGVAETQDVGRQDRLVLSRDEQVGVDDIVLATTTGASQLGVGELDRIENQLVTLPHQIAPGDYFLLLAVDSGRQVFEADGESNNLFAPLPLSVTRETSDLRVTSVAAADASVDGELAVSWTVKNDSPVPTNAFYWYDSVFLSEDAVLDEDDAEIGSVQRSNPLGPRESYAVQRNFELPEGIEGGFFVIVQTDATNLVGEGIFENNNVLPHREGGPGGSVGDVVVSPAPLPDLRVGEVDAPAAASSGQPIEVSWEVENLGPAAADRSWFDVVYLSLDTVIDFTSDVLLGSVPSAAGLARGASYVNSAEFTLPVDLRGEYQVLVSTGVGLNDSDRTNNVTAAPQPLEATPPPPADFVVGEVLLPANAAPGSDFSIGYTVTNQGDNAAVGAWTDTVYLSADDRWDLGDRLVGRVSQTNMDLAPGESYQGALTAPLPGVTPGDYQLIIRSDILNAIPEASEENNVGVSLDRAGVEVATLELESPVTGNLGRGQALYYKVPVEQAGETLSIDFRAMADEGFTELYVARDRVPTRSDHDFSAVDPFQASQRALVPSTLPGDYYVLAQAATTPEGGIEYELEAELLGFEVFDEDFGVGGNNGRYTISLSGAKFDRGAEVLIGLPDGSVLTASSHWYDNATRMYATFDLRGLPPGRYDVVVQNTLEESVLIEDSLGVVTGGGGDLVLDITAPNAVRNPRNDGDALVPILVSWSNTGLNDLVLPGVRIISSEPLLLPGTGGEPQLGGSYSWLADAKVDAPPGVLPPGARGQLRLSVLNDSTLADITLRLVELGVPFAGGEADWLSLPLFRREIAGRDIPPEDLVRGMRIAFGSDSQAYDRAMQYAARLAGSDSRLSTPLLMRWAVDNAASLVTPSIRGRFFASEGSGQLPTEIVLEQESPDRAVIRLPLNPDGSFIASQLNPGQYRVSTPGVPLSEESPSTVIVGGNDPGAEVILRAAELSRTTVGVLDGDSAPLVGATVMSLSGGELVSVTTTDDHGAASALFSPQLSSELIVISPDGERVVSASPVAGETVVQLTPDGAEPSLLRASEGLGGPLLELARIEAPTGMSLLETIDSLSVLSNLLGRSRDISASSLSLGSPEVAEIREMYSPEEARILQRFFIGAGRSIVQLSTDYVNDGVLSALYSSLSGGGGQFGVLASRFASGVGGTVTYSNDSTVASALRDNKVTGENLTALLEAATQALTPLALEAAEEIDCETTHAERELVFPIESIEGLPEHFFYHQGGLGKAHNWDFDGTIVGSADAEPRDTRRIRGNVVVTFEEGEAVVSLENITIEVRDIFDFLPGALGEGNAKLATVPLAHLEIVGLAKEVLIEVDYDVSFSEKHRIALPGHSTEECEGPEEQGQSWRIPEIVVREVRSHDPNDITGPVGFGSERWTAGDRGMQYLIRFENDPVLANAPAQTVRVTQTLDADLDPRTVRFGSFGFGEWIVDVDENAAFLNERVDATDKLGLMVDVVAGVDTKTGDLFWEFTSIDPLTGEPTQDAEAGFLPPNLMPPEGDGFVTYTVSPRRSVETGDVIDAEASIVFDVNEPIITPPIFNTLDVDAPTSRVEVLAGSQQETVFDVSWTGEDGTGGAGIAGFDIYVSENGGAYEPWLEGVTQTSAPFVGEPSKQYAFYSIARDNADNHEGAPATPDAVTVTPGPPPMVTRFVAQGGDQQRANVDRWRLVFDRPMDLQASIDSGEILNAVGLVNLGVDHANEPDTPVALNASQFRYSEEAEGGGSVLEWSLDSYNDTGSSLGDGLYLVSLDGSLIEDFAGIDLDGDGDGQPGGVHRVHFHRLAADSDGDGRVDGEDVASVNVALGSRPGDGRWDEAADLDRDGRITVRDRVMAARALHREIALPPTAPAQSPSVDGDLNGDGLVNAADYTVWRDHLGATGEGVKGDANGDGLVNQTDHAVWAEEYASAVAAPVAQRDSLAKIAAPPALVAQVSESSIDAEESLARDLAFEEALLRGASISGGGGLGTFAKPALVRAIGSGGEDRVEAPDEWRHGAPAPVAQGPGWVLPGEETDRSPGDESGEEAWPATIDEAFSLTLREAAAEDAGADLRHRRAP